MIPDKRYLAVLFLLLLFSPLYSQVSISPTTAFLDSKDRFETIVISNNSDAPQEISLDFQFAYPKANADGHIELIYDDEQEAALHSAKSWLRGFPKSFILDPGARQVVRVTAKPPRNIEPGVYWSRLITTSSAVSQEIGGQATEGGISANISMHFKQVTTIFFNNGDLTTGLEITELKPVIDNELLKVFVHYSKTGNAPFLGTMFVKVIDVLGETVLQKKMFVSIYNDGLRRLKLDVRNLPTGVYSLNVRLSSGRKDIPDANIVQTESQIIEGSFTKI